MAKTFKGSLAILIILVICCWPAAIIYFFMKREEDNDQMRTCVGCGANIPMQFSVCPHCGRPVMGQYQAAPPQQYNAPPQTFQGGQGCRSCGSIMNPNEQFCSKCGTRR